MLTVRKMELSLDYPLYQPDSSLISEIFEGNTMFNYNHSENYSQTCENYSQLYGNYYYNNSNNNHNHPSCENVQSYENNAKHNDPHYYQHGDSDAPVQPFISSVETYSKSAPSSAVSSTLPTPPQSPPSSEIDLDNIIANFPEILEYPASTLFPGVADVLLDLETCSMGDNVELIGCVPLSDRSPKKIQQQENYRGYLMDSEETPRPLKKDSMWGGGTPFVVDAEDHKLKTRTISESSDEHRHHCVYSDEEYEHLPDTPCVSDEDAEHLDNKEISSTINSSSLSPPPVAACQSLARYMRSVSSEHNYCEKGPVHNYYYSHDTDTDEEVDVVSWCEIPKPYSSISRQFSSSTTLVSSTLTAPPSKSSSSPSSSAQVKRQLQIVIHESIKNKQKKGRTGRAPKALKNTSNSSQNALSPSPPPPPPPPPPPSSLPSTGAANETSTDANGSSPKGHTQGKPASYTKRMREQHHEVLKTNKRRKTAARDPDDDLEKRSNHNIMERNRRVNIKNLFDELRSSVPEIQHNERASKVLILKKSKEYIKQLEFVSSKVEYEKDTLSHRNEHLKRKLQSMRRFRVAV